MRRFGRWLRANAEPMLALTIAIVFGLLGVLDVLGPDSSVINAAVLLTLALLAATLLRDRSSVGEALTAIATVRSASGPELSQAYADAWRNTDRWIFKGGTGGSLRTRTLPRCVEIARQEGRPLRVQLEVVDPTDDALCDAYARFRSTPAAGEAARDGDWTRERVRTEVYATILAVCLHRQKFGNFLTVEIGFSRVVSTFRWDLSRSCAILTQEGSPTASLIFDNDRAHYRSLDRELVASFNQARKLHLDTIDTVRLAEPPTTEEVRRLFTAVGLALPSSIGERDVTEIVRKAVADRTATG
ncbi:MAG TPA: hypothetical protein VHS35_01320 [Pseudonocardia sp.]|jgi:hypothetical protein|nr:hypothetical protein [Pseudonocardia sp.]